MAPNEIDHIFVYHAPTQEQIPRFEKIRETARLFAHLINESAPPSREQSLALTSLQQAVMWANAAIALENPPLNNQMPKQRPA